MRRIYAFVLSLVLIVGAGGTALAAPGSGNGNGPKQTPPGHADGHPGKGPKDKSGPDESPLPIPEAPVLHAETQRGTGEVDHGGAAPAPAARAVDGDISDWLGTASGFGGTSVYSAGELIYQDHIFDAYGPDDGGDAEREAVLGPAREAAPETYRLEPVFQADVAGQLGFPTPDQLKAEEEYGDVEHVDAADLLEVRVAADTDTVWLLARTTTLRPADSPALLVLADTTDADASYEVPFGAGITTSRGDVAVLLSGTSGQVVDLTSGATLATVPVAVNPSGWTNAIEAAIPRHLVSTNKNKLSLAVASGLAQGAELAPLPGRDGAPSPSVRLANAAFRQDEPVRIWFEHDQGLALGAGTIDPFFVDVSSKKLASRVMEHYEPRHGYHDRIFTSSDNISTERDEDGIHQHYGVWIPSNYDGETEVPMSLWLHWRGGEAHSGATLTPRVMRDQGEARGGIVVAPRGRGTSSWYLGEGHQDFLEVWDDAFATLAIDDERVYVSGHSMGGFGSYLLSLLYPDRFAGAFPVAGPVTQGAWTGLDFPGCDNFSWEDYSFCYVQTNNGDARTQHTRKLLENLRNVPIAIFQGGADELVPTSGVTRQVERLAELGYRHRYYLFPTYEHYSHPVVDEWMEGVRYLDAFRRPENPAQVTYVRDMPFERTVETGPDQRSVDPDLSFDFDSAYWMSGLAPTDLETGRATVDARSLAIAQPPHLVVPEAGGPAAPGQVGPYVMEGLAWLDDPLAVPATSNAFEATLTGASGVRFDAVRMALETADTITGTITADAPLTLELAGDWAVAPQVTGGDASYADGVLTISVPAGTTTIVISP